MRRRPQFEAPAARRWRFRPTSPNPDAARGVVARTESEFGRLDILVNNAGGGSKSRTVRRIETDDFEAVQRLNVTAPLVLTQAALPGMLDRGSGTVITISSYAAVHRRSRWPAWPMAPRKRPSRV